MKDARSRNGARKPRRLPEKGVLVVLAWREATPRIGEDSGWIKSLGTRRDAPGVGKAPATWSEAKGGRIRGESVATSASETYERRLADLARERETGDVKSGLGPKSEKEGKPGSGRDGGRTMGGRVGGRKRKTGRKRERERERERGGRGGRRLSLWHITYSAHVCVCVRGGFRGAGTTMTSAMCTTTTTTSRGGCTKTPWWGSGCRPYSPPLEMISVATRSREPQHVTVAPCAVPLSHSASLPSPEVFRRYPALPARALHRTSSLVSF